MKNVHHLIEEDLKPVRHKWLTADHRWEVHADSSIRVGFRDLLEKQARADAVYRELYPET